jgi:hypothetical protein
MYRKAMLFVFTAFFTMLALAPMVQAQQPWRKNIYNRFPRAQRYYSQPNYYTPPAASQSQSLSVAPIDIHQGDMVKVATETSLRRGQEVLATVPAGESFEVIQVQGPWVGIAMQHDGKETRGWVNHRALEVQ